MTSIWTKLAFYWIIETALTMAQQLHQEGWNGKHSDPSVEKVIHLSVTGHGGSILQQQMGWWESWGTATLLLLPHQSTTFYYEPIYTILTLQELISGASTCSQPMISLQKQGAKANAPSMLHRSSWRKKNKTVVRKLVKWNTSGCYLHHGFYSLLLRIIKLAQRCCADFTCDSDINIKQWHFPVIPGVVVLLNWTITWHNKKRFHRNDNWTTGECYMRICWPALKMTISGETFHGQEHAGTCMTLYQPADLLQLHPALKGQFNTDYLDAISSASMLSLAELQHKYAEMLTEGREKWFSCVTLGFIMKILPIGIPTLR